MSGPTFFLIRRDYPYIAGDVACNGFEDFDTRRVDAIVIGDQDPDVVVVALGLGHGWNYTASPEINYRLGAGVSAGI